MNSEKADILSFADEWAEKLPALSDSFERQRRLTPEVSRAFADAGVFHMLVPTQYGGLEVHPKTFTKVLRRLSEGDGSAGWNAMIGSTTGVLSA